MADQADGGDNGNRPLESKRGAADPIADLQPSAAPPTQTGNAESEANMKNDTGTTPTAEVVQLTSTLRTLAALDEVVDGLPVIDVTKVERIRYALETGAYRVSPRRIADKMVDFERDWH